MALDDGTFLMDAKRFDALCAEDAERASGLVDGEEGWADAVKAARGAEGVRGLRARREDFIVVAIGVAVPKHAGNPRSTLTLPLLGLHARPAEQPNWRRRSAERVYTLARGAAAGAPPRAYCYDLLESLKLDADGRAELDAWLDDAGFDVVEAEDPRGSRRRADAAARGQGRPRRRAAGPANPKPKQASAEAPEFAAPRTDGAPAAEPAPNLARAALARGSAATTGLGQRLPDLMHDAAAAASACATTPTAGASTTAPPARATSRSTPTAGPSAAATTTRTTTTRRSTPTAWRRAKARRARGPRRAGQARRVSGDADAGVNVAAEDASSDSETSSLAGLELDHVRRRAATRAKDGAAPAPLRVSPAAYLLAGVEAHADDPDSGARRRLLSFRTADGDEIGAHLRSRPQDGVEDAVDHIFAAYQDFLRRRSRGDGAGACSGAPSWTRARAHGEGARRRELRAPRVAEARPRGVRAVPRRAVRHVWRRVDLLPRRRPGEAARRGAGTSCRPPFVEMAAHMWALRDMLVDWSLGRHLLLIGNQGVGKNKLADRLLQLLDAEREYAQLHRDTTVQALTASPTLKGGVVVWEDSPLVKAARHGRCLVVDEADKAPLEVVCVLKALVGDGELQLADGRRLARPAATGDAGADAAADAAARAAGDVPVAPGFASSSSSNRPGFPFLGNDFYRECGDAFACHAVENADEASEVQMLRRYGPGVRVKQVDPQLHAKLMSVLGAEESHHEAEAEKPPPPPKAKDDVADKNTKDGEEGPNTRGAAKATQDGVVSEAPTDRDADPSPAPPPRQDRRGAAPGGSDSTKTPAGEGSGEAKAAEAQALGFKDGPAAAGGAEDVEAKDDAGAPASTEPRGRATADPGGAARIKDERPVASAGETSEERAQREKVTSALGAEDRRKTLHQLQMTEKDARQYEKLYAAVESQVGVLRAALLGREARERERTWKRLQTHGELDELMLVDGITGATNIYKRRSPDDAARLLSQQLPKRIKFVLDISGSMYTYNRLDGRLTRVLQALIMLMEALDGFEHKYEYSVVGHSGAASAVLLVPWASPPKTRLERLKLVRKMVNHAQTCKSGDHTLQATKRAVADVAAKAADEYFVFLLSDADFGRYDLTGRDLGAALTADPRVSAYALFIASNFEAAEAIKDELPPGKGFSCYDTSKLIGTLRDIFQASIVFSKHSAH
ncbi:midasin-like protein [Aureococcus anophagefferens]|uniref:Midasin-like protein n=1 Tax=Aureococcus anophagefferens TaxID=44056 RepID=A0ABR1G932_AURAN